MIPIILLVGVASAGVATKSYWWNKASDWINGGSSENLSHLETVPVTRGPFLVVVPVSGHIDSLSNIKLINTVEGSTTIISIVPEGSMVKAGDVVCELDSSALEEKRKEQKIAVTNAEFAVLDAQQAVKITQTENESRLAAAELALDLAKLDLIKYIQGEYPQQFNKLSGQVAIAQENLVRSEETYEFTQRMARKGYKTQNDVEAARIKVKQSKLDLAAAQEELKVLKDYTKQRTERELQAQAAELEREVNRVKLQNEAELTKVTEQLKAKQQTLASEKEKYDKYCEQIEACILRAPQDGQVVYANLSSRSRRSDGQGTIELGATVRERQTIINLPDVTQMKVDCRIHEAQISRIKEGVQARVRVVSFHDEIFNGEVTSISSVPVSGSWPNTDLRQYETVITLTDDVEKVSRLRPGLTAQVELLVDSRPDVLQVPVQAVVTIGPRNFVWLLDGKQMQRTEIKIGMNSVSHIEILSGVEEGQTVVQNPRHAFADEIAALEAELESENASREQRPTKKRPYSPSEMQKQARRNNPKSGGSDSPTSQGKGSLSEQGQPGSRRPNPDALIRRFDKDGNGKLAKNELPGPMQGRFAELDTNGDGFLTKEELAARSRPASGGGPGE